MKSLFLCGLLVGSLLINGCVSQAVRHARAGRSYVLNRPGEGDEVVEVGPLLGHAGADYFTVSCRTRKDADLTVLVNGRQIRSGSEEYHVLVVDGLTPATGYEYELMVQEIEDQRRARSYGPFPVRTLPARAPFTFVAYGDPQAKAEVWSRCAQTMLAAEPAFALSLGDMVWTGADKYEWERGLFGPAREFFAQVPHFAVRGNHDRGGSKRLAMLATPSGTVNWSHAVGPVRLVGVDLYTDWDPDSRAFHWLQGELSRADEPFVFLAVHAPPFSSTMHGETEDERAESEFTRVARETMYPLMKRFRGTAMLSGHAHVYERSELPGGVTSITSGGAGAKLYDREADAEKQNPYSERFVKAHHFLRFQVADSRCTMEAISLDGTVLDRCTWPPRARPR